MFKPATEHADVLCLARSCTPKPPSQAQQASPLRLHRKVGAWHHGQRTEQLGQGTALQFTWLCKYDHKAWAAPLAGCLPEGFSR